MPMEDWKPKEPAMTQKEPATTSHAWRPPSGKVCSGESGDNCASGEGSWSWDLVIWVRGRGCSDDMVRTSSWGIGREWG